MTSIRKKRNSIPQKDQPRPQGLLVFQYSGHCHIGKREDAGDEVASKYLQ